MQKINCIIFNIVILILIVLHSNVEAKLNLEEFSKIFKNKSIFFSSLNTDKNFSIDNYNLDGELHKPHKTDVVIIRLESEEILNNDFANHQNNLSIQISHHFYKIFSCINKSENYQIKNIFEKAFFNFVKISDESNRSKCYKKQDYFDKSLTRTENNIHIDLLNRNLYNSEELKYEDYYSNFNLKSVIDINLIEYNEMIQKFLSDFLMWNEYSYYELSFIFDSKAKIFKLNKIFIYFSYPPHMVKDLQKTGKYYFITLIKNGSKIFDNIFIFYKTTNKIMQFSKNHKDEGKDELTISDFTDNLLNYQTEIKTKKTDSVFHNTLTIKFNENFIENYIKKLSRMTSSKISEICFFIYQHLTEDTYIEKNELMNYLDNFYNKNKNSYLHSSFIEQELSSDLTDQFFTSFIICDEINKFKREFSNDFEIKYPIHFRYQPSIPTISSNIHQNVIMPHPYIEIFAKNNTVNVPDLSRVLFEEYFSKHSILDKDPYFLKIKREKGDKIDRYNERKIFKDEILLKLKFVINDYNFYISNREHFIHKIPAGKQSHLIIIVVLTTIFTFIGFVIILYGLVIYSVSNKSEIVTIKKDINKEIDFNKSTDTVNLKNDNIDKTEENDLLINKKVQ